MILLLFFHFPILARSNFHTEKIILKLLSFFVRFGESYLGSYYLLK